MQVVPRLPCVHEAGRSTAGQWIVGAVVSRSVMTTILIGDIPITITRKRIRHVHLRVHSPSGRVTMSAPHRVALRFIEAFAVERLEWIRRQRTRLAAQPRDERPLFADGERHLVGGREYGLVVHERQGRPHVRLEPDHIILVVKPGATPEIRARIMQGWHKSLLREVLPGLIEQWEPRLNVQLSKFHLRHMTTRWGTCNCRKREIRLNTELATKAPHLLEYVLVHELVHLIVPNHGPRFVALMDKHCPSWREARTQLNGSTQPFPMKKAG